MKKKKFLIWNKKKARTRRKKKMQKKKFLIWKKEKPEKGKEKPIHYLDI